MADTTVVFWVMNKKISLQRNFSGITHHSTVHISLAWRGGARWSEFASQWNNSSTRQAPVFLIETEKSRKGTWKVEYFSL
jgi:hypothetical protein